MDYKTENALKECCKDAAKQIQKDAELYVNDPEFRKKRDDEMDDISRAPLDTNMRIIENMGVIF